jgi:phosphoribosylformylglycinamidine synthase
MRESVRGLADGCRAFNAPVTGGNCSLYNQSPNGPIDPTPTVAVVGLVEKPEHVTTQWFKDEGDAIILLGEPVDTTDPLQGLGGSAYLQVLHGKKTGSPPRCNLDKEKELQLALRALIHSGAIKSAHDCSDGGLAVALAEGCISQLVARETPRLIGADVDLSQLPGSKMTQAQVQKSFEEMVSPAIMQEALESPVKEIDYEALKQIKSKDTRRLDALLFGETQARVVISVSALNAGKVLAQAKILGVPAALVGKVGGSSLRIKTGEQTLAAETSELHDLWWNSIAKAMN